VIGCDTVVALDGHIHGKPADEEQARATITALAGRTHAVVSGLAVLRAGQELTAVQRTSVTFRELDDETIAWYVGCREWEERSGGYAVQGKGAALVAQIDGEIDNVVGLPVTRLLELCPDISRA
jgi:septum formation protein